jgi:hypothetical protein
MYIWLFIVPVLAKLMSQTTDTVVITVFSYTFNVNLALPFSWKLFYVSALMFAFATLLFKLFCPKLIQEHHSYTSFESEGKPAWHLEEYASDIGMNYHKYKDKFLENKRLYSIAEPHPFDDSETLTDSQNMFWHLHREANKFSPKLYYACLVSYALGFLSMLIVFMQNIYWVVSAI